MFAAFNVLDGTVLGRCMQRHRHNEFIRYLNAVEAAVPTGKLVHVILNTYGSDKHPRLCLACPLSALESPHFTQSSAS